MQINAITEGGGRGGRRGHMQRVSTSSLIMNAPIKKIVGRLVERGMAIRTVDGWINPQPILKLTTLPIQDIILRYRTILNGFLNYYSFANNRPRLYIIYWILRKSLAKTLAAKLNLQTVRKVYYRFTKDIKYTILKQDGKEATIDFKCPSLLPAPKNFLGSRNFGDPLGIVDWTIRTVRLLDHCCANCGSMDSVEVHHVKHIKTLDPKLSSFDRMLATINRKQVPLCHECDKRVHSGLYDGMSLKHYKVPKWEGEAKWH